MVYLISSDAKAAAPPRVYEHCALHARLFPLRPVRYEDLRRGSVRRLVGQLARPWVAAVPRPMPRRVWAMTCRAHAAALPSRRGGADAAGARVCVFADLERLTDAELAEARALWRRRRDAGLVSLNDPAHTLRRYDLLRTLHEHGVNRFAVHRLTDDVRPNRWPVFIRREDTHDGPETPLLRDRGELDAAIERYRSDGRSWDNRIVVEYLDTIGGDGLYRKYGAFVIAGRVLPRHMLFSPRWMQKYSHELSDELMAEERRFVEDNPHERQLQRVAELAGVDYGRIDYGVLDGGVQVWEINTNPMICVPELLAEGPRAAVHRGFMKRYHDALADLCGR